MTFCSFILPFGIQDLTGTTWSMFQKSTETKNVNLQQISVIWSTALNLSNVYDQVKQDQAIELSDILNNSLWCFTVSLELVWYRTKLCYGII